MSFRTRLISFFVVIVLLPMLAVAVLVFRLIDQSQQGKADARASGLASSAASIYLSQSAAAKLDAATIARSAGTLRGRAFRARVSALAQQGGVSRVTVSSQGRVVLDRGNPTAVAPGAVRVEQTNQTALVTITVSELTAAEYARELIAPGVGVVVRQGGRILSSTMRGVGARSFPSRATVTVAGTSYRAVTQTFPGFGPAPVQVTVLSAVAATSSSLGNSRLLAAIFIGGFVILALAFAVLASRALQGQVERFLHAARRLGGGDFSSKVQIEGRDEFAALGEEFNRMSDQLAAKIDDLARERARLREAIRRIGQTFASNLDRPALLELALHTAVDAVQAGFGRLSARSEDEEPLSDVERVGSLVGFEETIIHAERQALENDGFGEAQGQGVSVASIALGPFEPDGRVHALISVGRGGEPFSDDDREVLRSLASEATLALENVELHFQARREAVTDEVTRLANHRQFQERLSLELEEAHRYRYPVGLIMLDIDDFKSINDTYGHPQGDVVLKHVARVLRDNSREVDVPARYGGEELALILPHTDVDGSYAIAERIRGAIEGLEIPRLGEDGRLRITVSAGVAATTDGPKDGLIAEADAALYAAKRGGKNRTMKAQSRTAEVLGAE